jgi:hypothetical protein
MMTFRGTAGGPYLVLQNLVRTNIGNTGSLGNLIGTTWQDDGNKGKENKKEIPLSPSTPFSSPPTGKEKKSGLLLSAC